MVLPDTGMRYRFKSLLAPPQESAHRSCAVKPSNGSRSIVNAVAFVLGRIELVNSVGVRVFERSIPRIPGCVSGGVDPDDATSHGRIYAVQRRIIVISSAVARPVECPAERHVDDIDTLRHHPVDGVKQVAIGGLASAM